MKTVISFFLLIISQIGFSQKIVREVVPSNSMNKNIDVVVILPDNKVQSNYKTVYILHGFSGNPERTIKEDIPNLVAKSKEYQTIYVIPDGNFSSWYVDSPIDKKSQYQTFIGTELINYIDNKYPTKKDKNSRGILGWSMGGYGALHIGLKNNNIFSVIGSTCGALDFKQFGPFYTYFKVDKVLGSVDIPNEAYMIYQKDKEMINPNQNIILDCGTEDNLLEMNRAYHNYLTKNNIEHIYIESLGKHDTEYWSKALNRQLMYFNTYLKN